MGIKRSIPEYQMMSRIGDHFGVSSHIIGRWLLALGLRVRREDKKMIPSPKAYRLGLVIELPDVRNGYPDWLWHWKKTIALLEEAGHHPIAGS